MNLQQSVICRLGGYVDSNPEILLSYPSEFENNIKPNRLLTMCLPFGSKERDIFINKYKKNTIISYVFSSKGDGERDDIYSFSMLIDKNSETEIYKDVLIQFIESLRDLELLQAEIFENHQDAIYSALNEEISIKINGNEIKFSQFFKNSKKKFEREKPKLKGRFY